jgi:cytochrome P450
LAGFGGVMQKYCPNYPRPITNRWTLWWRLLFGNNSLIEQLSAKAYRMQMGRNVVPGHEMFTVNDPKAVRQVLVEQQADYPKHRFMDDLLKPLLGRSIFTTNGAAWMAQRKLMEPAFEQTRMDKVFPLMLQATQALLERLRADASELVCDIEARMTHFTADVMFRSIFSLPLAQNDAEVIFRAFAVFQQSAPKATMPSYRPGIFSRWFKPKHEATATLAVQHIRALLHRCVAPRYAQYHECADQEHVYNDILASLLAARVEQTGQHLSVDELVNEIAVLFLAGHETSASALAWCLHFLAHSPDVQERVHAEIQEVVGDSELSLAHLNQLNLTRRVFRETLRLYPPLGFLVREASEAGCLRDKMIPAGATIVISPWLIHRHHDYWERPDEFDPDRFLTDAGRASAASAFLPFSLGPRVCVGAGFALQEAALALAAVMREFSVKPVAGHEPMPIARLSLRSDLGIKLHLEKRASIAFDT